MLNHTRRAPPPAPLIRLFNPNGEEGETQLDIRSSSSSSSSSSPLPHSESDWASSSGSESLGSFDEYPIQSTLSSSPSDKPYFQMRMKWLKGSTLKKHDNLPTSASSISEFTIPSPHGPQTSYLDQGEDQDGRCRNDKEQNIDHHHTDSFLDLLVKLTDSTLKDDGEVLLFFQSEQEPGQQTTTKS